MIKLILTALCIFLLSTTSYADISDDDGNNWNSWDRYIKVIYVKSFMSASCFVSSNNEDPVAGFCNPTSPIGKTLCPDLTVERYNWEKKRNDTLKRYCIMELSVGQIADGLDVFYKDFRNRQIRMNSAVYVVRKQIEGSPNEEIEAILLFLRKTFKDTWYGVVPSLKYKDTSGIEHEVTFP